MMVFGRRLGAGTLEPMPMCAYRAHVAIGQRIVVVRRDGCVYLVAFVEDANDNRDADPFDVRAVATRSGSAGPDRPAPLFPWPAQT
jgi:tRNA(Arg) A34 adenosine deaminase TadA